jgi:hypothetical protein
MMRADYIAGMPVIQSVHMTKTVPLFPEKKRTKRRMRRVIGKYGSWTREAPCYMIYDRSIIAHPAIYARLRQLSHQHAATL